MGCAAYYLCPKSLQLQLQGWAVNHFLECSLGCSWSCIQCVCAHTKATFITVLHVPHVLFLIAPFLPEANGSEFEATHRVTSRTFRATQINPVSGKKEKSIGHCSTLNFKK